MFLHSLSTWFLNVVLKSPKCIWQGYLCDIKTVHSDLKNSIKLHVNIGEGVYVKKHIQSKHFIQDIQLSSEYYRNVL